MAIITWSHQLCDAFYIYSFSQSHFTQTRVITLEQEKLSLFNEHRQSHWTIENCLWHFIQTQAIALDHKKLSVEFHSNTGNRICLQKRFVQMLGSRVQQHKKGRYNIYRVIHVCIAKSHSFKNIPQEESKMLYQTNNM